MQSLPRRTTLLIGLLGLALLAFAGYQLFHPVWAMTSTMGTVIESQEQFDPLEGAVAYAVTLRFQATDGQWYTVTRTAPPTFHVDQLEGSYRAGDQIEVSYYPWNAQDTVQVGPVPPGNIAYSGLQLGLIGMLLLFGGGALWLAIRNWRVEQRAATPFRLRF